MEEKDLPRLSELKLSTLPAADEKNNDISRMYSYTSDYLAYRDCPRRYMVFKKYGFAPSRSTTMFFGSLVHQTIEDLHHYLIQSRKGSS
jgi:DNA helicase-2/ATP-dependent DNA helicase PcrA